ncbi:MAG: SUMF1/EgtB/PvdO family nonheme iron enzyme [candidate division Zixibacteria bacterium]|nr:SUMF1/EgtB/PvdO family nonheme iron enzyme [candidate division Zixibacteria bacterium]
MKKIKLLIISILISNLFGCKNNSTEPINHAPVIQNILAESDTLYIGQSTNIQCSASDEDGGSLTYFWSSIYGSFTDGNSSESVIWQAPLIAGSFYVKVTLNDGQYSIGDSIEITVTIPDNQAPQIQSVLAEPDSINIEEATALQCLAVDEDQDNLTYIWAAPAGVFPDGNIGLSVQWQAPDSGGIYYIRIEVSDSELSDLDSVAISVNGPPGLPLNPDPPDEAFDQSIDMILTWDCSDPESDSIFYDVYFGESSPPALVSDDQILNFYDTGTLTPNRTYSWQIAARDQHGNSVTGPVWSFTTTGEKEFELGNSGVIVAMVWVEPGIFWMGAPGTPGAGDDEAPSHEVTLANGFWIGKYEVTQTQWQAVMGEWGFYWPGHPNRPAENVSWNDCQAFIEMANESEIDAHWRMPTEAEWEYCSRAGYYDTRFWWGDDLYYQAAGNYAWINTNSGSRTHDVGTTEGEIPNPWGIWDMGGNVWEWCEDWYHWGYDDAPSDGSAWVDPPGTQRILRGGSWYHGGRQCLPNLRSLYYPSGRFSSIGFRLARNP